MATLSGQVFLPVLMLIAIHLALYHTLPYAQAYRILPSLIPRKGCLDRCKL